MIRVAALLCMCSAVLAACYLGVLIQTLLDAARARIEGEVGLGLTSPSPAPLRLAVLMLCLKAFERGDQEMSVAPVEGWIAPYRVVRL